MQPWSPFTRSPTDPRISVSLLKTNLQIYRFTDLLIIQCFTLHTIYSRLETVASFFLFFDYLSIFQLANQYVMGVLLLKVHSTQITLKKKKFSFIHGGGINLGRQF